MQRVPNPHQHDLDDYFYHRCKHKLVYSSTSHNHIVDLRTTHFHANMHRGCWLG